MLLRIDWRQRPIDAEKAARIELHANAPVRQASVPKSVPRMHVLPAT